MAQVFVRPETLHAWRGSALLIVNPRGEAGGAQPLTGFYFREARFLRDFTFRINGTPLWLCESAALAADTLSFSYVYPEITAPGGGGTGQSDDEEHTNEFGIVERALDIHVTFQIHPSALAVTIEITNRSRREARFLLECVVDADYADIQEAQSNRREQQASTERAHTDAALCLRYTHPQLRYETQIRHSPEWQHRDDVLRLPVSLPRGVTLCRTLQIVPIDGANEPDDDRRRQEDAHDRWRHSFTQIAAPGSNTAAAVITGNITDVASFPLLTGQEDEWLALQAGIPLYPAFFGRDALTAGWQAALLDNGAALDAAMTRLGRLQADHTDAWRDAEPGRIPYQVRTGPLARLNLNPYSAYYADFASPLMFVISLATLFAWTGDVARIRKHWDTARRILDWARRYGDADGDGYLEYLTRSSHGTKNQGWKDSGDAITYDDGTPVPAPIATCELQGYWYIAQELMAILCGAMNTPGDAKAFASSAAALKEAFNRDWWLPDERFFAVALDPDKQQVRALTSNVGHCLACGIIDRDRVEAVAGRMFAPDLFSGWGVRTLSANHAFYDPISYHRGSVWAVEQATIVFGLRRFGLDARALDLSQALFDLAALYPEHRIPECVGGYARGERLSPGAYPRANTPQLWNASAFPLVIQSLLGILPLAPLDTLIVDPVLPTWLPVLELRDLRVGRASLTLRCERTRQGRTEFDVRQKRGPLSVIRQPPLESVSAGVVDRVRAAWQTIAS